MVQIVKPNGTVVKYIREARNLGLSNIVIVKNLIEAGWSKPVIKASLAFMGARKKTVRKPQLASHVGLRKKPRRTWTILAVTLFVFAGIVSFAWLSFRIFIVQGKQVFGYSFIEHSSLKAFSARSAGAFHATYADPTYLSIRQAGNVIIFNNIGAKLGINVKDQTLAFELSNNSEAVTDAVVDEGGKILSVLEGARLKHDIFTNVVYQGVDVSSTNFFVTYTAQVNKQFLDALFATVPARSIDIQTVEVPASSLRELQGHIATALAGATLKLRFNILSQRLVSIEGEAPAPSFTAITKQVVEQNLLPKDNTQSIKILEDAKSIQAALEKYKAKFGGYPVSQNDIPTGFTPEFLSAWPLADTGDACIDYYKDFTYVAQGAVITKRKQPSVFPSFSVTFCLPESFGTYKAGIGVITPTGILTSTDCPGGVSGCFTRGLEILEDTTGSGEDASIRITGSFE